MITGEAIFMPAQTVARGLNGIGKDINSDLLWEKKKRKINPSDSIKIDVRGP